MATRWVLIAALAVSCGIPICARATSIEGSVTYHDGKPAQGAVVYALNGRKSFQVTDNRIMLGEQLPRAITDRAGRFMLSVDPSDTTGFLAQDMNDAVGFSRAASEAKRISIIIEKPASADITVLNGRTGAANENVRLLLDTGIKGVAFRYDAKTDAKGVLRVNALTPGPYLLTTWRDVPQVGCCFRSVVTRAAKAAIAPGQVESITLGGSDLPHIEGKVTDSDGQPLHGVWVRLLAKQKPAQVEGVDIIWSTVSDRDGSYAIYDVPPGKYGLRVFRRLALNDATRTFEAIQEILVPENAADTKAYNVAVDTKPFMPLEPGQDAPAIAGKTLAGESFALADLKGKIVVLHFFASWCSACVQTIGDFDDLAAEFDHAKVAVVGVNVDETMEDALAFSTERRIQHPVLYQGAWADNPILKAYRVCNIPTTVVIGPDGRILNIDLFGGALRKYVSEKLPRSN
ncbi:MAG: carboxypeptidase regulatory-like domain-containing protein [Candidatus Hydrogenedentes bacterium]|nr:carboxypeptidase regulatory-like domain-containing protein [Candidatus Hydrogenedentota bacterium]